MRNKQMPRGHYTRKTKPQMEVTSIRLEAKLKEILKEHTKNSAKGYQDLLREILWEWVARNKGTFKPEYRRSEAQALFDGISTKEQNCAFTKLVIHANEPCQYALMEDGTLVPVKTRSLTD